MPNGPGHFKVPGFVPAPLPGSSKASAPWLHPERIAWILALICGVAPLWAATNVPLVDLPQHLHLISVLHRLDDASTLFPDVFARRPVLTPYLGYYYTVSLLNWLVPLELANRLFLSAYVVGLPLALGFLLASLRRPTWPALLAIPFAYGDSFGWGFINYCAALPLAFLTCGLFVRAIEDVDRRRPWAGLLAASLVSVLLFHVQVFAFLGLALPFLLLTTASPEGRTWRARGPALLGVVPGVLLFVVWFGLRVGQPQEVAPGAPWKAWGPMLSEQNLAFKGFAQNLADLIAVPRGPDGGLRLLDTAFPILAGMGRDGADQWGVRLAFLAALVAVGVALRTGRSTLEGPLARFRIVGLAALALLLFFAMPFDIRGYMYYLNTRYAHLAAALLVVCVPPLTPVWAQRLRWAGVAVALVTALPLWATFSRFEAETQAVYRVAQAARPKARVMGLIYNTGSAAVRLPVHLHDGATVARLSGGLSNFSFALTPHSPLMYRGEPPPTFPSEWRPDQMQWEAHGRAYDHFLVKGAHPSQIFGGRLGSELTIAAQEGDLFLVVKR